MKTIAQQLEITEFPFTIKDKNGKQLYFEASDGYWEKRAYNSNGYEIYFETSDGYWAKREYNSDGHLIYYENSDGDIEHNRPSENIKRIREFFRQVRLMTHHHLGLGAIKLTVEQQDEICYLVESLINKRIDH